jgi:hypothetical protein
MNARALVDHIHSGPTRLELDGPLQFRRRTRSNPCDFNDFLRALLSSKTILEVNCGTHRQLSISEVEWRLLVKTLGGIEGIQDLTLACTAGSRDFHPFQGFADAVEKAQAQVHQSLQTLCFDVEGSLGFPRDASGIVALADALKKEHSSLVKFGWTDDCSRIGGHQDAPYAVLEPVLQALSMSAFPKLRRVHLMTLNASANAIGNLLHQLRLGPEKDQWLVLQLSLAEECLAVAEVIREDHCNVERLTLKCGRVINGQDMGLLFANALMSNTRLRYLNLRMGNGVMSIAANEAFASMLRINTNVIVQVLAPRPGDERYESYNQVCIEQLLNQAGRGRLLSSSETTTGWLDALNRVNHLCDCKCDYITCTCTPCGYPSSTCTPDYQESCMYSLLGNCQCDSCYCTCPYTSAFHVSCVYSLLRMEPSGLFGK